MAIRKNSYGVWQCDFTAPDGSRIRRSLETKDKKQAQEYHDKLKHEAWRVKHLGDTPTKTFDEACLRWINEKHEKKSLDDDKSKISYFLVFFSGVALADITEDKIQMAVIRLVNRKHRERWEMQERRCLKEGVECPKYIDKPVSAQTRHSYLSFIRGLLNACKRWRWLDVVPMIETKAPKNGRVRWISADKAQEIFSYLPDYFKSIVIFALSTGLRRSNIIKMEWSQVDLERSVAWVNPDQSKSGRAIGIPLNETALSVIKRQAGNHEQYVFTRSTIDGYVPLRVDSNKVWYSALKKANVENFRFHDLRHTWASWLIQSGVPDSVLKELGGWESVEMVKRYAHLSPSHLAQHTTHIDHALGKVSSKSAKPELKLVV
ncbi:site-specific tyrosine recombinase XerC [Pragia fontium]|uniref:tyrosine-type recombinase/integrase n=1 Tax=Pragia fontium TaxID=82985 RepID=UPI000DFF4655|nr:site-specific integrase [Pragia fontium]SUB81985.1 site-specific tyrosine recombinase XerC [Pragia fontium]